jgi:hypothetical protein
MPRKYQQFPLEDIGLGLDTYSPKDKIPSGALSDALNIDAEANSTISLRKGYERYYGNFPFRPTKVVVDGGESFITFGDGESVDLSSQGTGPLQIEWDSSSVYLDNYRFDFVSTFTENAGQWELSVADAADTFGYTDNNAAFLVFEKTTNGLVSNQFISAADVQLKADGSLFISTETDPGNAFVYPVNLDVLSDNRKIITDLTADGTVDGLGITTLTPFDVSTFPTLSILTYCYEQVGSDLVQIQPAEVRLNTQTQELEIDLDLGGSTFTGKVFLISAEVNRGVETANVEPNGDTYYIDINTTNYPGVDTQDPFNLVQGWATTDTVGELVQLEMASIDYYQNQAVGIPAKTIRVGYKIPAGLDPESISLFWQPASFNANEIVVASTFGQTDGTYESPKMTVWGLDHSIAYKQGYLQAAYVNHIDNYRSEDEERLIASLGQNLLQAGNSISVSSQIESSIRTQASAILGPVFTAVANNRTDGEVVTAKAVGNYVPVDSITDSGDSAVVVIDIDADLTDIIFANLDYLVLTGCAYKANNGRYLITGFSNNDNKIQITISNPNAKSEGSAGRANIFSSRVKVADGQQFALGDFVSATSLTAPIEVISYDAFNDYIHFCGCTRKIQFATGVNLYAKRTSKIIPLASSTGFVRGDMVKIGSEDRSFRVKQVVTFSTANVTITSTGSEASITKAAHGLNPGDTIFLYGSNNSLIDGEHVLNDNTTDTLLAWNTTLSAGTYEEINLLGNAIEIDESYSFVAGPSPVSVSVEGRWDIVESPVTRAEAREELTRVSHFDELNFYSQPSIQSSVVNNSMYLANGADETKKYDGASIYNAGLPPFQPWCFLSVDTEGGALAGGTPVEFAAIDVSFDPGYFVVDTNFAAVNDRIKVDTTNQLLTVTDVQPFGTGKYKIFVEEDIDPSLKTKVTIGTGEAAVEQLSGITANDYDEDLIYKLNTNGTEEEEYTVTALPRADDYAVYLLSVKVDGRECSINQSTKEVTVYQPYGGATSGLVIEYEVPPGSSASWKGETVLSGVTKVEFDPSLEYVVTAFNSDKEKYTISFSKDVENFPDAIDYFNYDGVDATVTETFLNRTIKIMDSSLIIGSKNTGRIEFDGRTPYLTVYRLDVGETITDIRNGDVDPLGQITNGQAINQGIVLQNGDVIFASSNLATSLSYTVQIYKENTTYNSATVAALLFLSLDGVAMPIPARSSLELDSPFLVSFKLNPDTDLANCKIEFCALGNRVVLRNQVTSADDIITSGQSYDLSEAGPYMTSGDIELYVFSQGSVTNFHQFTISPSQGGVSDAELQIYDQSDIAVQPSFAVKTLVVLPTIAKYRPNSIINNVITFNVLSSFDTSAVIVNFLYRGISVKVGDVVQESGVTENNFSDKVELLISNPDTVKTREYILTHTPAPANTTRELKSLSINGNIGNLDNVATPNEFKVYVPKGTNLKSIFLDFEFEGSKVTKDQAGTNAIISGDFSADNKFDFTPAEGQTSKSVSIYVFSSDDQSTEYKVIVEEKDFKIGLSTDDGFIAGYYTNENTITVEVPFAQDVTSMVATFDAPGEDGNLKKANIYRYYIRYNAIDSNDNIISSAMLGSDDMYAEVFDNSDVDIKALAMPAFNELDYSRIDFELYRTVANSVAPFYRVYTSALEYGANTGYINITDNITDFSLTTDDTDVISSTLLGGELGTRLERPPVGKVVTSADNRLVLGNITSPHFVDITFRKKDGVAALDYSDFRGMDLTISTPGQADLSFDFQPVSGTVSQIGTDGTVTHDFADPIPTDCWVYLTSINPGENKNLEIAGWFKTVAQNKLPITLDTALTGLTGIKIYFAYDTDIFDFIPAQIPILLEVSDGNINQRNFYKLPAETQVSTKISMAVNAVMAQASAPNAWLLAQGGQSYPNGQFRLRQVANPDGQITVTVTTPAQSAFTPLAFNVYVNNLRLIDAETGDSGVSERRRFPSRLAVSYRNFSEIFDDCYRTDDTISTIIDVNPADGQEITAAVPFFGASAFGAAQLSQALVVFKTNSVYLVDIASNNVQKLQTQGQGCTAPKSVAVTKNGIFFANESGVYRLGTDMKVMWMGKALDGIWRNELEKTNINLLAGHNYAQERRYKLSYPIRGDVANSRVAVYDSAREELGQVGSWTAYDNHPALGWCNQTADSFFASTLGRVYKVRNRGEASDYRDDDQGIPLSFTFGATNFGMPDERKITESVTVQFQNEYGTVSNVKVLTEQSLSDIFNDSGSVTIPAGDTDATIRFSLPQRKGTHVRTRIVKDATVDEGFQISSLTYGVRTTGSDGVPQSRKFRS